MVILDEDADGMTVDDNVRWVSPMGSGLLIFSINGLYARFRFIRTVVRSLILHSTIVRKFFGFCFIILCCAVNSVRLINLKFYRRYFSARHYRPRANEERLVFQPVHLCAWIL